MARPKKRIAAVVVAGTILVGAGFSGGAYAAQLTPAQAIDKLTGMLTGNVQDAANTATSDDLAAIQSKADSVKASLNQVAADTEAAVQAKVNSHVDTKTTQTINELNTAETNALTDIEAAGTTAEQNDISSFDANVQAIIDGIDGTTETTTTTEPTTTQTINGVEVLAGAETLSSSDLNTLTGSSTVGVIETEYGSNLDITQVDYDSTQDRVIYYDSKRDN
ncbi:hypothetical protein [Aquibacillus albus]|uniref:Uncharacterized protein n=1 Tax=Aquibacillus albus TaxID=1168171 RepID=A0ABS2N688_9BACI|nr:hypothetical protein [Aquibacillus albus]MBM7573642.1 hypothetical protein [Aquibacillus albus]